MGAVYSHLSEEGRQVILIEINNRPMCALGYRTLDEDFVDELLN